jgi:hypothetical protein
MGCSLVWQIKPKSSFKSLPRALLYVLEKRYSFPCYFDCSNIDYIQGLIDADIEGASELMKIVCEYQEIELNVE